MNVMKLFVFSVAPDEAGNKNQYEETNKNYSARGKHGANISQYCVELFKNLHFF
jgi:hypothetical protein